MSERPCKIRTKKKKGTKRLRAGQGGEVLEEVGAISKLPPEACNPNERRKDAGGGRSIMSGQAKC